MINVSTFAGCFALRLRSTAAAPLLVPRHASPRAEVPDAARPIRTYMRSLSSASLGLHSCVRWLLTVAAPAAAQGFGIGARMAWVNGDVDADGPIPSGSSAARFGWACPADWLEVSLDRHTEEFELLNQKVKETPIQVSLLLKLAGGSVPAVPARRVRAGTSAASSQSRARGDLERQHHRVRLARRRRRRSSPGPALRHPRRLSLHLPRLQRRRR